MLQGSRVEYMFTMTSDMYDMYIIYMQYIHILCSATQKTYVCTKHCLKMGKKLIVRMLKNCQILKFCHLWSPITQAPHGEFSTMVLVSSYPSTIHARNWFCDVLAL